MPPDRRVPRLIRFPHPEGRVKQRESPRQTSARRRIGNSGRFRHSIQSPIRASHRRFAVNRLRPFFSRPHASPWFPLALFETHFAFATDVANQITLAPIHAPEKFRARSEPSGRDYSVWPAEKRCIHSGNRALNRCLHVQAKIFRAVGTRSASKAARKSRRPRGPHAGSVACAAMPAESASGFSFVSFASFVTKMDCSSICVK